MHNIYLRNYSLKAPRKSPKATLYFVTYLNLDPERILRIEFRDISLSWENVSLGDCFYCSGLDYLRPTASRVHPRLFLGKRSQVFTLYWSIMFGPESLRHSKGEKHCEIKRKRKIFFREF